MSDEGILIGGILGGIAVMGVGILTYVRRREAQLASQQEIEIPIGWLSDPWLRQYAVAAVLSWA
jgi:hypothetical protein